MDDESRNSFGSKEKLDSQRRNSRDNTEYVPTRCRITKPIPPKPATNPMQFVKIGPCELYRKAQEQLKKVEEVKSIRQEIRDEAEDWQANLDNWKSSRRKRQEHMIERVVEVKKYEQQEMEKGRRKSKTFNEILEERNKRKYKLSISLYENDDPNDLSDYGIGGPKLSSENESNINSLDNMNDNIQKLTNTAEIKIEENDDCKTQVLPKINKFNNQERIEGTDDQFKKNVDIVQELEQYTYEGAIQGYRTRVISKTNISSLPYTLSENNLENKNETGTMGTSNSDVHQIISKGSILKRKQLFENDNTLFELNHFESNTSRQLSEDFIHSQSLKERLLSLEKYSDQPLRHFENVSTDSNIKNNNTFKLNSNQVRNHITVINYLSESAVDTCEERSKSKSVIWPTKRFDSPDHDIFVNELQNHQMHRSLDNLTDTRNECIPLERVQSLDRLEYYPNNYPPSTSSTELLAYGDTDREDSGIHTADVSCSVSQADEPIDDVVAEEEIKRTTADNVYSVMQFDGVFVSEDFPLDSPVTVLEPPKEKPPPPPVADIDLSEESELKRFNSTKRIKKEMRIKRSSFLGINFNLDDQPELEASIRKPPDMNSFLQRESRLEKQMYKKSQSQSQTPTQSNYSEAGDSQDSGVELERGRLSSDTWCSSVTHTHSHSRQNSEPCTTNSFTSEEDDITKKEREIIELVEKEEKWRDTNDFTCTSNHIQQSQQREQQQQQKEKIQTLAEYVTSKDDEHSEVLRVEHDLLQLEREEFERQRENMMFRESRARIQSKMYQKNKRLSLEDISGVSNQLHNIMYQPKSDSIYYRKSMPELQREVNTASSSRFIVSGTRSQISRTSIREPLNSILCPNSSKPTHPMNRYSLQMLSTTSKPRLIPQDDWKPFQSKQPVNDSSRDKFNYSQHWLIQEAEQRRLSAQSSNNWKSPREKHIPDSIIQTLTQRVQNKMNLPERSMLNKNVPPSPHSVDHALPLYHPHFMEESPDKMLSVSGKKKCSYCGNELGRGAAMIIESLCLFYHMDCFKCCVCHFQLGDGLMGTDVRVRNNKLHCHNCYSSDDGVKFSCV